MTPEKINSGIPPGQDIALDWYRQMPPRFQRMFLPKKVYDTYTVLVTQDLEAPMPVYFTDAELGAILRKIISNFNPVFPFEDVTATVQRALILGIEFRLSAPKKFPLKAISFEYLFSCFATTENGNRVSFGFLTEAFKTEYDALLGRFYSSPFEANEINPRFLNDEPSSLMVSGRILV